MANDVAVFNPGASLPAYAKNHEMSALTKALAGGSGGGGFDKRISIKGGVFRLISAGKQIASVEERYLDVVIVAAAPKISRTYYDKTFDDENASAPVCWSHDGDNPAPDCKTKMAPACVNCPKNEKGSGQGESRACRFNQRIAVVLANDIEGDVLQLQLAATSIFGKEENGVYPLQAYARWLAAQNVEANMVITRMKFDLSDASYPCLGFKAMRWLTEDEHETAVAKGTSKEATEAVTLTVSQVDKVPAVAAVKEEAFLTEPEADDEPPPPPPKAKAKPKAAPEAEAPAPEPKVRPAAAKAAPEVASAEKLASVLDKWDDED